MDTLTAPSPSPSPSSPVMPLLRAFGVAGSTGDSSGLLQAACEAACEVAGAPHAAVVLLSSDGAEGMVRAEHPALGMARRTFAVRGVDALQRLVSTRAPLQVADVLDHGELSAATGPLADAGVRAMLAVPVLWGERILGWLAVHDTAAPRGFGQEAVEGCRGVAAVLALALVNARLTDESRTHTGELQSLRRASVGITSLMGAEEGNRTALLERIVGEAVRVLGARSGGIYRYTPALLQLTLVADFQRPHHRGKTLRLGEGLAGTLLMTRAPYIAVPDYGEWAQRARVFDDDPFGAVLEVPIRWRGRASGVLYVDDVAGRQFTSAEAGQLRALADQAALVLAEAEPPGNAAAPRLTEESEASPTRRSLRLAGISALDDRLNHIAHLAATGLNAQSCQVLRLCRPGILSLEASYGRTDWALEKGRRFEVRGSARGDDDDKDGLAPFRACGEALQDHLAVRGLIAAPGGCHSVLAVPLVKKTPKGPIRLGLLRLENKTESDPDGGTRVCCFTAEDERKAELYADALTDVIRNENLVRQLREQRLADARRKRLLKRLFMTGKKMRAEMDTAALRQEIPRRAARLLGYDVGCLYEADTESRHMVAVAVANLPPEVRGDREPWQGSLPGRVLSTERAVVQRMDDPDAEPFTVRGQVYELAIAAPLRHADGAVASVLVVAGGAERHRFVDIDREILELYAAQAATLLQSSILWNWQRGSFLRSSSLRRIEEFMRRTSDPEKILAALLTGITAGYGLRFNRAAAFLLDERAGILHGRMAIGHMTEAEARAAWERHHAEGMESPSRYLKRLERGGPVSTPLDKRVRAVSFPLGPDLRAVLAKAEEGRTVIDTQEVLDKLPADLVRAFGPVLPLVLVPLSIGDEVLGFLVADTAFARTRAQLEDLDGAVKLASVAARALDPDPRRWEVFTTEQLARMGDIGLGRGGADSGEDSHSLSAVERQLVSAARYVFNATSAVLWTYDEPSRTYSLRECAGDILPGVRTRLQHQPPQEGGATEEVMRRGWVGVHDLESPRYPFLTDSTREVLREINVRSFQGVALTLPYEQLGVMYLHYAYPRPFGPDDTQGAVRFAEHAALMLKQAQMLDQVTRARRTARVLAQVGTVETTEPFWHTLDTVAVQTRHALLCDAVTVFEYDSEQGVLLSPPGMEEVRDRQALAGAPAVAPGSFLYRLLNESEAREVEDAPGDLDLGPTRFCREEGIKSCIAVPLRVRGQPVGLMFVNYRTHHQFTGDERYNIALFAAQAAVVIHNAQLYRRLQQSSSDMHNLIAQATIDVIDQDWRHKAFKFSPAIAAWVDVGHEELVQGMEAGKLDPQFAVHLHGLLDEFLERTQAELGKRPVKGPLEGVEDIPVNAFLRKLTEAWTSRNPLPGTQICMEMAAHEQHAVSANPQWLLTIVEVLFENAIIAMEKAGERVLVISTRCDGRTLEVDFTDTGCGLDPGVGRAPVATSSTRGEGKGLGVGLRIVRTITAIYHGELSLLPAQRPGGGQGATARLSFPVSHPRASEPEFADA